MCANLEYLEVKRDFFVSIFKDDPQQALILEVIRNDRLRQIERQKYA